MLFVLIACLAERPTGTQDSVPEADADTDSDADTDLSPFVRFTLQIGDESREVEWTNGGGQQVRCYDLGGDWLWLHFTDEASTEDSEQRLDIDVCNYAGSGSYMAYDPRFQDCPGAAQAFDLWWTEQAELSWVSAVGQDCEMELSADDAGLGGAFSCAIAPLDEDAHPDDGRGDRSLHEGSFWCPLEPWE